MSTPRAPLGLDTAGRALWRAIVEDHELDASQLAQLHEACRAKDRLDSLDAILRGDITTWTRLVVDLSCEEMTVNVRITSALTQANSTATVLKQLLAALRLPDERTGKRPQYRGPRGAQNPSIPGGAPGKVSSLDRARASKSGQ